MDKKKTKEEKVGADGLTKKERRALKIQTRQLEDDKNLKIDEPLTSNKCDQIDSNKKTIGEITSKQNEKSEGDTKKQNSTSELSEKEKRKLEWNKKLAEQKNQKNKNDVQVTSKAEEKARRREIQEAQRLAKKKNEVSINKKPESVPTKSETKTPQKPKEDIVKLKKSPFQKAANTKKLLHGSKVQLLNHLYHAESKIFGSDNSVCFPKIHPAFIQLGVQYSSKTILGSNARCISLLSALKKLINDLKAPSEQEFGRYLESVLQNCSDYLQKCRPMAVSMINALRLFKLQLTQIDKNKNSSDDEKKQKLIEFIDTFINDEIFTAWDGISLKVLDKISNGDTILIYGCSSLIKRILFDAFENKKQFKVIIVDSRPLLEGREMLRRLSGKGIECTYILINALSYVMSSVTKVLLGAHALLTNGYVMSRTGTAQVALVAREYNKPVLVCCETYKFSERVQTDSLVYNEIGDPDSLLNIDTIDKPSCLSSWIDNNKLSLLNLLYDVTPPDLVTAIVTELAILPCTSVPVVLRIKPIEM